MLVLRFEALMTFRNFSPGNETSRRVFSLGRGTILFREFLHLALVALHTTFFPLTPLGVTARPNRNLSWTTSKTVSVLIATVCMAPLSASEALAISVLSWPKWTMALLLNSKRTRC